MDSLWITLPIFALIGLGWAGARRGLFDTQTAAGLSQFVFWLAFPALLLTSMAKAPVPGPNHGQIILVWLGVLLGGHLVGRGVAWILGHEAERQAGIGFASSSGNTAFLGTALLASLFDHHVMALAAALVAVENILVVGLGVAGLYAAKPAVDSKAVVRAMLGGLFNPVSLGALIGFALALTQISLPASLMRPLDMLGAAASPAGLVALGIVMATSQGQATPQSWQDVCVVVLTKCALIPLAMWFGLQAIGADRTFILAATLLAACPSAVNVFIQARQAGIWAATASRVVFITTCVSLVGLSLIAGLAN